MDEIRGNGVVLRPTREADVADLARIRDTPDVRRWWRGEADVTEEIRSDIASDEYVPLTILDESGAVLGQIYFEEPSDPDYRHASIDIYIDPQRRGRGIGTEALRTLARHLFTVGGHHRLTIDPAVDNVAAIRSYEKVGFRPVGVMRRYEIGEDGTWHDGLLMDLLGEEFLEPPSD